MFDTAQGNEIRYNINECIDAWLCDLTIGMAACSLIELFYLSVTWGVNLELEVISYMPCLIGFVETAVLKTKLKTFESDLQM